ncbi:MAG: PD40 domain-containing protein [Candidatus Schekmanbacteria bacterium]|nr:PD40 domain-containing protein [Candidatus Schekmanbacteria bacterium]
MTLAVRNANFGRVLSGIARIAILGTVLAGVAGAGAAAPKLSNAKAVFAAEQVPIGQQLIAPAPAPDGKTLAYEALKGNSRFLFLYDGESGSVQQVKARKSLLTQASAYEGELDWCLATACAGSFVFVSGSQNNLDIYAGKVGATEAPTPLTAHKSLDFQPRFDPAANRVAFLSGRDRKSGSDLYLLDLDKLASGVALMRLTNLPNGVLYPEWSPDGRYIVFSAEGLSAEGGNTPSFDLWLMDLRRLPETLPAAARSEGNGGEPVIDLSADLQPARVTSVDASDELAASFAPDGTALAFYVSDAADATGTAGRKGQKEQRLALVELKRGDGSDAAPALGEIRTLVDHVADPNEDSTLRGPVWLADGSALLVVRDDPETFNPIVLVDRSSGEIVSSLAETHVNKDLALARHSPSAGIRLFFSAHEGQSTGLYEVRIQP